MIDAKASEHTIVVRVNVRQCDKSSCGIGSYDDRQRQNTRAFSASGIAADYFTAYRVPY